MRQRHVMRSMAAVAVVACLCSSCGTMQHDRVDGGSAKRTHYRTKSGRTLRVQMGRVDAEQAELAREMREAVGRYLVDQGKAALARHDLFDVADSGKTSASLLDQFMETGAPAAEASDIDGWLDITVLEVKEHKGPTVRVGLMSRQSKEAVVKVKATLRLANGKACSAKAEGKSTKGACGVVAMVNRDAMSKKGGVWDLDGSSVGLAASRAVDECVAEIAGDLHRDVRRLNREAVDRLLRPRTRVPSR